MLKGVLGGYSSAAADGSAWTTVLSKAGGATVRARVHALVLRVHVSRVALVAVLGKQQCVRVCVCECVRVCVSG